ncbi:hypothetical protein [Aggregatibacter actinomycetemcomitans]|nr:hypothetical protein [Aggregatibacter actinomycetemcomitans]
MTKLFSPTFKQQCVDLMLKQHHTSQQNDVRQHIGIATPDSSI